MWTVPYLIKLWPYSILRMEKEVDNALSTIHQRVNGVRNQFDALFFHSVKFSNLRLNYSTHVYHISEINFLSAVLNAIARCRWWRLKFHWNLQDRLINAFRSRTVTCRQWRLLFNLILVEPVFPVDFIHFVNTKFRFHFTYYFKLLLCTWF